MRVSVVGNSGSGKTTAATRIAERLELPRLELDGLRHQAGWVELPDDEMLARVGAFIDAHQSWVIDGNYGNVRDTVWAAAELVVWMDPPRAANMRNIVSRSVRRVVTRAPLWNGNREQWRNLISIDPYQSVIAWAWTRHRVYRERYSAAMTDPAWSALRFVRVGSRAELDRLLDSL